MMIFQNAVFIINEKGIVVDKIDKVDTKQHA